MKIIAIIPARGGSKGVPKKNIRLIYNKPLIVWSIEQALASKFINRVIVSTDCIEIANISKNAGAEVPELRPSQLAQDETATEPVLIHAIKNWCSVQGDDIIMLLQPTSPMRLSKSIDNAITYFKKNKSDSLVSVSENHSFFWKNINFPEPLYDYKNRLRRQDINKKDKLYRENGSIYMTRVNILLNQKNRLGGKISMFLMEESESLEIDSELDFFIIEELMKRNKL